ncbi:hypothetical protein DAERI_020380 [Deinococcus aerius]|uniref:Membrane-bound metal-dependent hydrolase n=2 Tax=Deinococcus TaxID=1298 RepID=A0A2I9CSU6_9DEIO|nr:MULTISPECIES: DUF2227 family putative metal-binding protein [Deinococcus]MBB5293777.1 putative metal-binding protein [Deinococcus metallilatus]QBY07264.1 hypothetical protein E5F05_04585 [Deinococcus metallilatus]RXJ14736.1 hypothetical protein ERJ73_03315 [Deinococcus metallilatus]TLK30856.1 hypothetical protein FCS05_03630 [Deinococcus metallilatus]GBF04783.1 hypothetical protein DAERI_020380 [Deinococcus aerius]
MPSGDLHTGVNLITLVGIAGPLAALHVSQDLLLSLAAGYLTGTLLITPDLDLAGHVRVRARCNWGVWGGLWRPLSLFVRHRGVTHTYVRGPLLLLGYAAVLLTLPVTALLAVDRALDVPLRVPTPDGPLYAVALGGYLLAYWLHLWLDGYRPWNVRRW